MSMTAIPVGSLQSLWRVEQDGRRLSCLHCGDESLLVVEAVNRPTAGTLLLVHGLGEHPARHLRFARDMADRGVRCVTFALAGHGDGFTKDGPGRRLTEAYFLIPDPAELRRWIELRQGDAALLQRRMAEKSAVLAETRARDHVRQVLRIAKLVASHDMLGSGLPLFLAGHSLGGLVCAAACCSLLNGSLPRLNGLILLSPALAPHGRRDSTLEPWVMRKLWEFRKDNGSVVRGVVKRMLDLGNVSIDTRWTSRFVSDVAEENVLYLEDPLVRKRLPLKYLSSIEDLMVEVDAYQGPWPLETLVLTAERDGIVGEQGALEFSSKYEQVRLIRYAGLDAHELSRSSVTRQVARDVGDWVRRLVSFL
jgi:alpha-beta hydrolase superfamily lysophospholipase